MREKIQSIEEKEIPASNKTFLKQEKNKKSPFGFLKIGYFICETKKESSVAAALSFLSNTNYIPMLHSSFSQSDTLTVKKRGIAVGTLILTVSTVAMLIWSS